MLKMLLSHPWCDGGWGCEGGRGTFTLIVDGAVEIEPLSPLALKYQWAPGPQVL